MAMEMVIEECEAWDPDALLLTPVTRLYHLPPIGLGTPMVESLTGYIVRLAEEHCVSAGVLYRKEIQALADKGNIFTFRVSSADGYPTHTINGLGSPAADFVRALETLTGRRDLSGLTLLAWRRVLPGHSLLRRCRAWCESCMYTWREANQPIYEPLLWTLQAVTVCPYHRRILRQACPHCERQIGPLDSRSRRDRCSRCGQTLIPTATNPTSDSRVLLGDELEWASWVASALGELLAAAPQITCPPGRDHLAQTIRVCVDKLCSRNASALARLLHVGRGAVSRWRREKSTPRLAVLLSMAYRLGISLLELLLHCPDFAASQGFLREARVEENIRSQQQRMAHGRRIHPAEVSRVLHIALNEIPPPSMDQVMRRLSHAGPTIYRHFPELCRQIARHYAEYRVQRAIARKVQAAEEVRRVAYELHAKGTRLTRRHIRPLLTSSDYLNLEEGRTALREVRRQLALQASSR
jgi:transcriptional regulator with XRE-family HTH domain